MQFISLDPKNEPWTKTGSKMNQYFWHEIHAVLAFLFNTVQLSRKPMNQNEPWFKTSQFWTMGLQNAKKMVKKKEAKKTQFQLDSVN